MREPKLRAKSRAVIGAPDAGKTAYPGEQVMIENLEAGLNSLREVLAGMQKAG
jgi:hypothetical protein